MTDSSRATREPALLFDVFGTLVDWRRTLIREFQRIGELDGVAADWAALVDAWRGAYAPAMDRVRRGERPWADLDVLHGEALDVLLPRFGAQKLADRRSLLVSLWHRLDAWPDVPSALRRLRERHVVASLSNGHLGLQLHLCRHADLAFDTLFSAEHFGHYKPDPETYLGAARLLGLEPGKVMLAASHPSDLRAAAACGLQTLLVRRPLEYGSNGAPQAAGPPAADGEFDYATDDLSRFVVRAEP